MARYLVKKHPGIPFDGPVGYVLAGSEFKAPADFIPHTPNIVPLDEEALNVLKKAFPAKTFTLGEEQLSEKDKAKAEQLTGTQAAERYANRTPPPAMKRT